MGEISNIIRSATSYRRIISTIGLLIAAIIISYAYITGTNGDKSADISLWLGIISAIILIIYALKTQKSPKIQYSVIIFGLLLVIVGIISVLTGGIFGTGTLSPIPVTGFIAAGLIIITLGVRIKEQSMDLGIQDERSLRIGTYGISYSWYLTYLTVACIGWLAGTKMVIVDGATICLLLIILMPISAMLFQWYFNKRGDVY